MCMSIQVLSSCSVILRPAQVHSTGTASYEWVPGHRCNQPAEGFAEKIHFKCTTDKNQRNNMKSEWSTGYFVGINGKTTEYLVATADGVFSCATINRLPDDEAYDPECINIVKVTYRDYVPGGAGLTPVGVRFGETHIKNAEADPITAPMVPRRARLKPEDFQKLGYTVGCPGCDQFQIGGSIRRNHTDVCRDRIEASLSKTDMAKIDLGEPKTD